jgi:hypothetical protein
MIPLALAFAASLACNSPPGTVVARLLPSGGDGKPILYKLTGGDTADFRVRGTVIVVGLNGFNPAHCGTTVSIAVTATQDP